MILKRIKQATHPRFFAPGSLLALVLLVFGDLLFGPKRVVLSQYGTDIFLYFYFVREFGFDQIRHGNFPLWNPHLFSGTSFFGNLQPALLYPVNWIHLFLPVDRAINLEIVVHVYLTGVGMYLWARHQNLHRAACLVAATIWMFGGPYFLKITAGHLAPLGAMCWIPWILLAVDWLISRRFSAGCLMGIFAGSMQLLAGHPQTAYNTTIAVMIYVAISLIKVPQRRRVLLGLAVIGIGAIAISAAQLGAGWAVAQESARAGAVPLDFARTFAQPPENFLTLFAPDFFTDLGKTGYWGRAYLWEVSLFMSVSGLFLIVCALTFDIRKTARFWLPLIILWLFAVSAYTPLFSVLYYYLPGFNKFRGHSKFIVPAATFFAMLAAVGLNNLITKRNEFLSKKIFALGGIIILALLTGTGGAFLHMSNSSIWTRLVAAVGDSKESYAPYELFKDPSYIRLTAEFAGTSLLICSAICILLSALIWSYGRTKYATFAIGLLAIAEVVVFSRTHRPTFELSQLEKFTSSMSVKEANGRERYLGTQSRNAALGSRTYDLWGYDPVVLGRYIEFMAWSQGYAPNQPNAANIRFLSYNRLYSMLRCRYIHLYNENGEPQIAQLPPTLPQLILINNFSVVSDRDKMFRVMKAPSFEPHAKVLLESPPLPIPSSGTISGYAKVIESTTDYMIIEAEVKRPALLLITDSYSKDWKAWGLAESSQKDYSVMPANYVLRAIPLQAGKHKIRLEYSPTAFHIGKWISLLSLIIYCTWLGILLFKRKID